MVGEDPEGRSQQRCLQRPTGMSNGIRLRIVCGCSERNDGLRRTYLRQAAAWAWGRARRSVFGRDCLAAVRQL